MPGDQTPRRRRLLPALLILTATVTPALGRAAAEPPVCVPNAVAGSPARCTFNVWGFVRDANGIPVRRATVRTGEQKVVTDNRGFFDLALGAPGTHQLSVTALAGCKGGAHVTVDGVDALMNGGKRHDVKLPCTPPTYNAFGFGYVENGRLHAIARAGLRHAGESGSIDLYTYTPGGSPSAPEIFADTHEDDRDAAGGFSRSGALIVFYGRFDAPRNRWAGVGYRRKHGTDVTEGSISLGSNQLYSPYGPLVQLPSGKLMQTLYGHDGARWRIYTTFSTDDGRTWSAIKPVDVSPPYQANEAAAVLVGGTSDATASIVMVARAYKTWGKNPWYGLVQYISRDGGSSWMRLGPIDKTKTTMDVIPWVMRLDASRIALVWADRGKMTIRRSVTAITDALKGWWYQPTTIYRSRVPLSRKPNRGDFGYPSIVSYGPKDSQKAVVFNDADPAGFGGSFSDVDLYVLPLWPGRNDQAVSLSP